MDMKFCTHIYYLQNIYSDEVWVCRLVVNVASIHILTRSRLENVPSDMCTHGRFRSACPFVQSDQNLHRSQFG